MAETIADRADTLSNLVLVINGITVVGHKASAEWRLDADNTGPLYNGDEVLIEATGHHVHLAGAIFADFRDDRIKSFRYRFSMTWPSWSNSSVVDGVGGWTWGTVTSGPGIVVGHRLVVIQFGRLAGVTASSGPQGPPRRSLRRGK